MTTEQLIRQKRLTKQSQYRATALKQMRADQTDPRHGTIHGYDCGCRCEKCKEAAKATNRKSHEKYREQLERNPDDPRHGTYSGYCYGCRCDRCEEAATEYRKARKQPKAIRVLNRKRQEGKILDEMQHDRRDPRHGTNTGYGYGCRCDRCKEAHRLYGREIHERHKEELLNDPTDPRHGTTTGYSYGCRCERCRAAVSKYAKAYYKLKG